MKSPRSYATRAIVRTLVPKEDDEGRTVPVGTIGAVVYVHKVPPGARRAYVIEVVVSDEQGRQIGAHMFDAWQDEIEPAGTAS